MLTLPFSKEGYNVVVDNLLQERENKRKETEQYNTKQYKLKWTKAGRDGGWKSRAEAARQSHQAMVKVEKGGDPSLNDQPPWRLQLR